jgi:hypothetical protein
MEVFVNRFFFFFFFFFVIAGKDCLFGRVFVCFSSVIYKSLWVFYDWVVVIRWLGFMGVESDWDFEGFGVDEDEDVDEK